MPLENVTHPFYAIENYLIPSMPLFLIFHSLYAIGVKNTNGAVKLKDKRTIIPLAPIPCPLSTTTDVWDPHVRFIFNLEPIGSTTATEGPARAAEARAAPPLRPPSREPPHAPRPPSGPCHGRRQAGHHVRRILRHRPHPPPHPCSGAVARCVLRRGPCRILRRGPRPPSHPCPSRRRAGRRACRPPRVPRPCRGRHALRRTGRLQRTARGPACHGRPSCPSACVRAVLAARGGGRSTEARHWGGRQPAEGARGPRVRARTWWPARRGHGRGARGGRSTEVQQWADGG